MLDRGIGVAGLGLALIFGLLQYFQPKVPQWISIIAVAIGLLMLGLSAGLIIADHRNVRSAKKVVDTALLRLHIYNDNRIPDRLSTENIFRWYYLSNIIALKGTDGNQQEIVFPTLFITFDPDVRVTTLRVGSPDMQLPRHEVKAFNQRFAIIAFMGELSEGTLEVTVSP